ncbi:hypothetical protein EMVG_00176 [Emiliania huxleyi virus PS401]|nr:hypothetical protein EMVG_00176 [Emiliania huxleyi virus PS401]
MTTAEAQLYVYMSLSDKPPRPPSCVIVCGGEAVVTTRGTLDASPFFRRAFLSVDTISIDRDAATLRDIITFLRYLRAPDYLTSKQPQPLRASLFLIDVVFYGIADILLKHYPSQRISLNLATRLPPICATAYNWNISTRVVTFDSNDATPLYAAVDRDMLSEYTMRLTVREMKDPAGAPMSRATMTTRLLVESCECYSSTAEVDLFRGAMTVGKMRGTHARALLVDGRAIA